MTTFFLILAPPGLSYRRIEGENLTDDYYSDVEFINCNFRANKKITLKNCIVNRCTIYEPGILAYGCQFINCSNIESAEIIGPNISYSIITAKSKIYNTDEYPQNTINSSIIEGDSEIKSGINISKINISYTTLINVSGKNLLLYRSRVGDSSITDSTYQEVNLTMCGSDSNFSSAENVNISCEMPPSNKDTNSSTDQNELTTPAIIGISISAFVVIAAIIGVIIFFILKKDNYSTDAGNEFPVDFDTSVLETTNTSVLEHVPDDPFKDDFADESEDVFEIRSIFL